MNLLRVTRSAAAYGQRHLMQDLDYRLGRGWSKPDKVTIRLTQRCNAKCLMCDFWQCPTRADEEIATERWIEVIEELHSWLGTYFLTLTGGEVFLKRGIFDLLRRVTELDISINVLTNGLALRSEKNLDALVATGVSALNFSVDGCDAAVHDKFRGVPGIFDTAVQAVKGIKQRRPEMVITFVCIVMRETIGQMVDYVKWAADLGVDRVLFQPIVPNFGEQQAADDWYLTDDHFVQDSDQVRRVMDQMIALNEVGSIIANGSDEFEKFAAYFENPNIVQIHRTRCMLGQTNLNMDEFGRMDMCYAFNTTIGNIDDRPLHETWQSAVARQKRKEIKQCRRPCMAACYRSFTLAEKIRLFFKYVRMGKI